MPKYEWICRICDIYWERECPLGKAPDRTRCPECKKLSNRYWQKQNVGVAFGLDADFHTVRSRANKIAEKGFDKTAADKFLHNQIRHTKDAMDDESFRYKGANIDWDKFAESRNLKKVGEKEARNKVERAKKLTAEAYDKANKMGYKDIGSTKLDITKPNKQS
jgi:hypothetical protein